MTDIITGKQAILVYCREKFSAHSWNTIRRWKKELGFPVHYLPSQSPFIIPSELIIWAVKFDELTKENNKNIPL